ncbi:MAG: hypothetical protein SPI61_00190 [Ezakiella sp.]|uniref:hypothetical protein n=1 Tax=Ezakiella sp. TaxID=1935205 RepID=UPI002A90F9AA|nr:hypothetical protein [Ezakiella sp.]MDY6079149.1 hypothetical protein [Ezakiella sp.]
MLTTKRFIKEVQNLGFEVAEYMNVILIRLKSREVALIGKLQIFCVNTEYPSFNNLPEELKEKLYNLIDEYTRTPIEDREEEQKYYLEHKWLDDNLYNVWNCLNLRVETNGYSIGSPLNSEEFKTQFTQAEIDEIKEKLNTNLEDFEQVPIEDRK